jgi:hypothetical protein
VGPREDRYHRGDPMTGRPSHDGVIGVGPALRKARAHRGLSLEEAARDTRLRTDQLQALEEEDFDALGGEVYARACLRTYAAYLGLRPEKVMRIYARHADDPEPPRPPERMGRVERAIAATRIRDNQRFLLIAAAVIFFVLIIFGLLSRDHSAPPPAAIATDTPSAVPSGQSFDATLTAQGPAGVTVTVDGILETFSMTQGEERSFMPVEELRVEVASGGSVGIVVAGRDLGIPGTSGDPWSRTFTYAQVSAWPSPSPSLSPSGSASESVSSSATP